MATGRSVTYAAIQMRRGLESEMDRSKFLPAEFGSTTDSKKLFFAFGSGVVKQISTLEDMQHEIDLKTEEIVESITEDVEEAVNNAQSAAEYANNQGGIALTNSQLAEQAANAANAISQDLQERLESGELNGPPGAQGQQGVAGKDGKDGANGVVVTITGQFAMQIQNGHLHVIYPDGGVAPNMEISSDGHLLWSY